MRLEDAFAGNRSNVCAARRYNPARFVSGIPGSRYVAPVPHQASGTPATIAADISSRQNEHWSLELLAAQRQLYV